MGFVTALKEFFGALNAFFRGQERRANEEAGGNKVIVGLEEKRNEIRKDADDIKSKPDRNRMQRD